MLKNVINFSKKKIHIDSILLINLTLAFFPISFILGNFIVNLNLVLFCLFGIFHLRSKILKINFNLPLKIIFLLFFVIFFSTSLSFIKSLYFGEYEYVHLVRLMKSLIFFRFFVMLIIIYLLSKFDILNLKYLFISAALSTFVVSLDVIYQYVFGFNIIGLVSHDYHNSGFFGDEHIAGSFIQNFSFFLILLLTFAFKDKNNLRFVITTVVICIIGVAIIVSGNKMPLILFLFGLLLIFLFNNKLRIIIPVSLICLFVLFKFILSSDTILKDRYESLFKTVQHTFGVFNVKKNNEMQKNLTVEKEEDQQSSIYPEKSGFLNDKSNHVRLLLSALDTWKKNKIFGNGIKSFRIDCYDLPRKDLLDESAVPEYNFAEPYVKSKKNRLCSTHPHNYYFEILTETGVVGLFFTLMIASLFIVFILKNFKSFKENNIENFILLAATISLILKVFPIQSSGSIFSTNDSAYIILISSIILSYKKKLSASS